MWSNLGSVLEHAQLNYGVGLWEGVGADQKEVTRTGVRKETKRLRLALEGTVTIVGLFDPGGRRQPSYLNLAFGLDLLSLNVKPQPEFM